MVHPIDGFVAQEKFPSVAALNAWFDKTKPPQEPRTVPEHRLLPPAQEEIVSPEERAQRVTMLKGAANAIRAAADARKIGDGFKSLSPIQIDSPERRMIALKNLEAQKQKAAIGD